ncbi:MAG TPA: GntR family transcriptional regulator [Fimbriimonas sp.]|nr:GntR family transcriptional regulator [Fimbriimonas sp.]
MSRNLEKRKARAKGERSWRTLADQIRNQIHVGDYAPGSVLPSETDLAARFQSSRGTIRKAIDHLIESGELERKPHSRPVIAYGMKAARNGRDIFVWISRPVSDEVGLRIIKGVSRGLANTRYRLVIREPSRFEGSAISSEERQFLIDVLKADDVAGAIIERDNFAHDEDVILELSRRKHLVFVDAPPPHGVRADHVGTPNVASAQECVEYLIGLGHSRIVCVLDSDVPQPSKDRAEGYRRAMKAAGLEANIKVIVACDLPERGDLPRALAGPFAPIVSNMRFGSEWPVKAVEEICNCRPQPTALFIGHDAMAYWVSALLEGRGIRIPEDISIAGFDWNSRLDPRIPDVLTTVAQDFEGFGFYAANLLLDRLNDAVEADVRQVLIHAPLVVRSSTANFSTMSPLAAEESWGAEAPIRKS